MQRAIFSIRQAGRLTTVQDHGRRGYLRFGVPASGPMDRTAFTIANAALGNPRDAAAIEISPGGLVLECIHGDVTLAVAGGGFRVQLDDRATGSWIVATVRAGTRLSIRPGPWGNWTYLAFAGKITAPDWLGSRATHAASGLCGGMIHSGDRLEITATRLCPTRDGPIPCPVSARPRPEACVVPGPQDRYFSPETRHRFLTEPFRLTDAYDRMGVRLAGPALTPEGLLDMPSEPIVRGSVQVAGDGVATVLLADHQTTGGYPKIATVVDADLDAFAQIRSHSAVSFRAITPEAAVQRLRLRKASLQRYLARLARQGAAVS